MSLTKKEDAKPSSFFYLNNPNNYVTAELGNGL